MDDEQEQGEIETPLSRFVTQLWEAIQLPDADELQKIAFEELLQLGLSIAARQESE